MQSFPAGTKVARLVHLNLPQGEAGLKRGRSGLEKQAYPKHPRWGVLFFEFGLNSNTMKEALTR